MSQEVADVLRQARKLIERPERWCKGSVVRNASGNIKAYGAIAALDSLRFVHGSTLTNAMSALHNALPGVGLIRWFADAPETTHADILALYDRAIAAEDAAPDNKGDLA